MRGRAVPGSAVVFVITPIRPGREGAASAEVARLYPDPCREAFRAVDVAGLAEGFALVGAAAVPPSSRAVDDAAGPVMRRATPASVAWLRGDEHPLGHYVPQAARVTVDAFLTRPGLVPQRLVRELIEHEAMEEVMHDVLYDVLIEFSEKVNPFFAEWGLPALLKRVMPIGFGAVTKALELVRQDFNARLEPEIRRFLKGMTRKALHRASGVVMATSGDAKFVALRKRIAHWLYEQPVRELMAGVDDERAKQMQQIGEATTRRVLGLEEVRAKREAVVRAFVEENAAKPLGEVLASYGVEFELDLEGLAAATWPMLASALKSEPVRAWVAQLVGEFFDGLGRGE